jgi:hypothetical protein
LLNPFAGISFTSNNVRFLLTRRRRGVSAEELYGTCSGAIDDPWRQAEVLQEPRVQLQNGLDCTKEKPTSVPTRTYPGCCERLQQTKGKKGSGYHCQGLSCLASALGTVQLGVCQAAGLRLGYQNSLGTATD